MSKKDLLERRAAQAAAAAPTLAERIANARQTPSPVGEFPHVPQSPAFFGNAPQAADPSGDILHVSPPVPFSQPSNSNNGRFETVSVELIDPNPFNARQIYRSERVAELANSIQAHGQDVPGIATIRDGRYVLAAGHYRLRAIKVSNIATMNLMVHDDLTDKDLYERSYRENKEREPESALDNALCWRDLLANGVYATDEELADSIGQSKSNVSKTLRILDLPDSAIEEIKKDPAAYAVHALYELILFYAVAKQEHHVLGFLGQLRKGDIGRKEIKEARDRIQAPKTRKSKETSRPYALQKEGAYTGSFKVFPESGRLTLDVTFKDQAQRDEILALLKSKFDIAD